jgi:hypothetical protein
VVGWAQEGMDAKRDNASTVCSQKLNCVTVPGRQLPAGVGGFGGNRKLNSLTGLVRDTEDSGRATVKV